MKYLTVIIIGILSTFQCLAQENDDSLNITNSDNENFTSLCLEDSVKKAYFINYNIDTDTSACPALYCQIYDWLGVKYAYGESSKNGTDCSGLVSNITKEFLQYKLAGNSANMYANCKKIRKESLQEFDLVFFKINTQNISHVGIYLQNGNFVHSTVNRGVMISNLEEAYYKKYFIGGGRKIKQLE